MQTTSDARTIEDLIETLEDGARGFERAAELLEDGENADSLASEMRDFADQRRRFSAELRELAAAEGHTIEERGSAGGAVHRAWMALKDAVTGTDAAAVLEAAETGEDHAVSEYQDALEAELSSALREVVARQASAVGDAHDRVRSLRDTRDS